MEIVHVVEKRVPGARVRLHRLEFFGGEFARLLENEVGDGDLADVVQRRGGVDDLGQVLRRGRFGRVGLFGEARREEVADFPRPIDVFARVLVARFGEFAHCEDRGQLGRRDLLDLAVHAILKLGVLIGELALELHLAIVEFFSFDAGREPCAEHLRAERLLYVIGSASFDAVHDFVHVRQRGHDDDGDVPELPALLHSVQQFCAGHHGHHQIENNAVREDFAHGFESFGAVFGFPRLVSEFFDLIADKPPDNRRILHNQYGDLVRHRRFFQIRAVGQNPASEKGRNKFPIIPHDAG